MIQALIRITTTNIKSHQVNCKNFTTLFINPTALRKTKIVYNFGLSKCRRVKTHMIKISKYLIIIMDVEVSVWPSG